MWNRGKKTAFLLGGMGTLLILLFPFGSAFASEITPAKVIDLVNESRMAHKESILVRNETLTRAAQMKVDDMFEKGYFAHNSPEGTTPWTWFDKAGYDYEYAGENLAIHFVQAEEQQRAWMESTTHRKNILSPNYHEIGVAVRSGTLDGRETTVTVQEFGSRMGVVYTQEKTPGETSSAVSAPAEKMASPAPIQMPAVEEIGAQNRAYENVLLFVWGIMIAQIVIVGYMIIRRSKPVAPRVSVLALGPEDNREYVIPVHIETSSRRA